jgi:hypothetical protein
LVSAGLEPRLAILLAEMPNKLLQVDPRRPFREAGVLRDEVMFVRSGILSKFKTDNSGRRQIVALRESCRARAVPNMASRQSSAAR